MYWTFIGLLPYLITFVLAIFVAVLLRRFVHKTAWWFALTPVMFGAYFVYQPIYQGDFSNNYEEFAVEDMTLKEQQLTVLAIPGCEYCYEVLERLNTFVDKNQSTVNFIIFTSNEADLNWYKEIAHPNIVVEKRTDSDELIDLAAGRFPCMVFRNKELVYVWNNNDFGYKTMDFIEDFL